MAQFVKKSLHFLLLYGPLLFIPAFLYLAYNYISSKSPQYKVSASILVKGASQQSVMAALKSKSLIGHILDQKPLEASYFFASQPKKEIYPDSSPVKVTVKSINNDLKPVWVSLRAADSHQYELTWGDTSAFYQFNELVNESYGSFVVARNNKVDSAEKPVNVEMVSRAQIADILYNDLYVGAGHKGDIVQLALVTGNPKKGADILNTLINTYGSNIPKAADDTGNSIKNITTVQYDTIKTPAKDLGGLKNKASELSRQIISLKEQEKNAGKPIVRTAGVDKNQAKIYRAVDEYVKRPVEEFVQVPYVDEIENPDLNDQVNEFNEMELSRSHLTAQAKIDSVNRQLMALRSSIVEKIAYYLGNGRSESGSQPPKSYYENQIASKQQKLDELNKEISTAGASGFNVAKTTRLKKVNVTRVSSKLIIIDKPGDNVEYIPVNSVTIYGLALLAGLLFPIAAWIVRIVHRNSSSRRRTEPGDLSGQINDFFHVKQID